MVFNMIVMYGVMDFGNMPADKVEKIMGKSIHSAIFLYPTIILVTSVVINGGLGAYMLAMKVKGLEKAFAITSMIFGGFAIPIILFFISLFTKKKTKQTKIRKWPLYTAFGIATVSPLAMMAFGFSAKGLDSPTDLKSVKLSLDVNKPNLIEIFTDGFDNKLVNEQFKDMQSAPNIFETQWDTFNQFYGIEKFITAGGLTNDSFPSLVGGDDATNFNFEEQRLIDAPDKTLLNYVYSERFVNLTVDHMNQIGLQNKYIINPIGLSDSTSYATQISGDVDYIKSVAPDFNVLNWGQAKRDNAGAFGISNKSPDSQIYNWLGDHMESSTEAAHIYLEDLFTHSPNMAKEDGTISWNSEFGNEGRKIRTSLNHLAQLFEDLKSVSNGTTNAFENSMIVIYGDHHDHSSPDRDENGIIQENRSFAMIKYPVTNTPTKAAYTPVSDYAVWSPHIQKIIENGLTPSGGYDFIKTNPNFAADRNFVTFSGVQGYYSHFAKASSTELTNGFSPTQSVHNFPGINVDAENLIHYEDNKANLADVLAPVRWI